MALTTDKKLYIAVGVLALMGGAVYMQGKKKTEEALAYTPAGRAANLPKIEMTEETKKAIDKVVLVAPPEGTDEEKKKKGAVEIELQKLGEDAWVVAKPVSSKANTSSITSMLDNLMRLEVTEDISPSKDSYAKFGVSDDKALHATFYQGADKKLELYAGESGGRGQMMRLAGRDGVFAVKGFSKFLYGREVKDWRDKTIFKFEDKDAVKVDVTNENGVFAFQKAGEEWKADFAPAKKGAKGKAIDRFDKSKVEDLLRAYKALSAIDFGDPDKDKPGDKGLEPSKASVTVTLKDGAKYVLDVGDKSDSNYWVRKSGDAQLFTVSSWAADWATAKADKFQKAEEKKGEKKDDEPANPHGMPGMPGMPDMGGGDEDEQ